MVDQGYLPEHGPGKRHFLCAAAPVRVSVGTLRDQITYPHVNKQMGREQGRLLARVELDHLVDEAVGGAGLGSS